MQRSDALKIIREVLAIRRPDLLPLADQVEHLSIEQLEELINVVAMEFSATGLQEDWEPNPRGMVLDDTIGFLANLVTAKKDARGD